MSETIAIDSGLSKKEKYETLHPQLVALMDGEPDAIANTANTVAALKDAFGFFWVGFYFVRTKDTVEELVLGPFQGPIACTRISKGKGVCGKAWADKQTVIVPDVELFPGHIACNAASKSEIVIPVIKNNVVIAILDVDSDRINDFNEDDKYGLEKISTLIASLL